MLVQRRVIDDRSYFTSMKNPECDSKGRHVIQGNAHICDEYTLSLDYMT